MPNCSLANFLFSPFYPFIPPLNPVCPFLSRALARIQRRAESLLSSEGIIVSTILSYIFTAPLTINRSYGEKRISLFLFTAFPCNPDSISISMAV